MKKVYLLVSILIFGILSCKKQDLQLNSVTSAADVKAWLSKQKMPSSLTATFKDNINNIDFESIRIVDLEQGRTLKFFSFKNPKHNKRQVFVFDFRRGKIFGYLIEYATNTTLSDRRISELIQGKVESYTGSFTIKHLSGLVLTEMQSKGGKLVSFGKLVKGNPPNNLRTGCKAYYLETTYYYSDGSTETTRVFLTVQCPNETDQTDEIDPIDGSDGGGGDGPIEEVVNTVVTVDTVANLIQDSCKNAIFLAIGEAKLKNFLSKMYNSTFTGYGNIANLLIADVVTLQDQYGNEVPGAHHFNPSTNTYTIRLNNHPQFSHYSREQWAAVMSHEILHAFRKIFVGNTTQLSDHQNVIQVSAEYIRDMLIEAYGLDVSDATGLALNGVADAFGSDPDFDPFIQLKYKMSLTTVLSIFNQFSTGQKGVKCQ